jgi:hypothetical protein
LERSICDWWRGCKKKKTDSCSDFWRPIVPKESMVQKHAICPGICARPHFRKRKWLPMDQRPVHITNARWDELIAELQSSKNAKRGPFDGCGHSNLHRWSQNKKHDLMQVVCPTKKLSS